MDSPEGIRDKKREKKLNGGGGGEGALLAWPTTAASLQITMEIHISNWKHKFQNRTGLDAKANSELYKSNRVCSADWNIARHRLLHGPAQDKRPGAEKQALQLYPAKLPAQTRVRHANLVSKDE
jgi:hypothetical protein